MGIEFKSRLDAELNELQILQVKSAIRQIEAYEVINEKTSATNLELGLKFKASAPGWEQDVLFKIDSLTVHILFHASSKSQREAFIRNVERALSEINVKHGGFEEL